MLDREDILSWSILTPVPQCVYHQLSDSHLVYWQGIAMTRLHAMMIIQEQWINSYPTPYMKQMAYKEFLRSYWAGAFGSVIWNLTLESIDTPDAYMTFLRKILVRKNKDLFENLKAQYSIKDAMLWFANSNLELLNND